MYADDTHLTYAGEKAHSIQLQLQLADRKQTHSTALDLTKTEFMLLGESRQRLSTLGESPTINLTGVAKSKK